MDWRALDAMAENRFRIELQKAKKWVEERHRNMHPSKKAELARKIAKKAVNKWLEENYGINWDGIRAKIRAEEEEFKLEDIAV